MKVDCFFCHREFTYERGCRCSRAQAYDKLEKALSNLPPTLEELIEFFRSKQRLYPMYTCDRDPIAVYLKEDCSITEKLTVGISEIHIKSETDLWVRVPMPSHIIEFIQNFDNLEYPDMIDRKATNWRYAPKEIDDLVREGIYASRKDYKRALPK